MQFLKVLSVLSTTAAAPLSFAAEAVRADGWTVQGPVVYRSFYAAAPVNYFPGCQSVYAHSMRYTPQIYPPRTYAPQTYAPPTYSQQPSGYPQGRVPTYAPPRPTT